MTNAPAHLDDEQAAEVRHVAEPVRGVGRRRVRGPGHRRPRGVPQLAEHGTAVAFPRGHQRLEADARFTAVDRDPSHALLVDRVGMTDLVKRATPRADAISEDEYRRGLARVERLCVRLRPKVVCFVGLSGWRAAVDPRAVAGWQPDPLGGAAVYLMPSTSGVNAHVNLDDLVGHLGELRERVPRSRRRSRPRGTEGSTGRDT